MSSRTADEQAEKAEPVEVGQRDPMSAMAAEFGLPLCCKTNGIGVSCTRAAGHDESVNRVHGSFHAATSQGFIVKKVW